MAKKKKEHWIARLKRTAHELLEGESAYISPAKAKQIRARTIKKKKAPAKVKDTTRTKAVTSQLRKSGLTEKQIAKLRGK